MQKKETVPIIPSKDMKLGSMEATARLSLFGDYESPETRHLNSIIMKLMEEFDGKINFVFRHFPLTQIHQRAHKASEAAIAAGQEGKFWEMHQLLMEHPSQLGIISLKSLAREAGVVNKKFLEQLMNGVYGWNVQDDLREGLTLGIRDIPALLINGKLVEKPFTAQHIRNLITIELDAQKKPSSGRRKAA